MSNLPNKTKPSYCTTCNAIINKGDVLCVLDNLLFCKDCHVKGSQMWMVVPDLQDDGTTEWNIVCPMGSEHSPVYH